MKRHILESSKGNAGLWITGIAFMGIFLTGLSNSFFEDNSVSASPKSEVQVARLDPAPKETFEANTLQPIPPGAGLVAVKPEENLQVFEGTISKNESLSELFGKYNVPMSVVFQLVKQARPTYNLNRLHPGRPYTLNKKDNKLVSFTYQPDENRKIIVEKTKDGFDARLHKFKYETRLATLDGTIKDNLVSSVLKAGGSYQLAIDLEEIFSWEINFFKDLRAGDSFKLSVEKKFREKRFIGYSKIMAAVFKNRGKELSAIYYRPEGKAGGYYTPSGKSLKKQFLKSPVKYTRITSTYTNRRFHPIYKKHMPHKAVDYAAPRGTPILAVSDGIASSVSRNSRSGKYIKLKHRNGYESSYSHLSKYGPGIRKGKRVHQGQVIGYIGSTGAATGPHLCFHMRKNGRSINPLALKSPQGPDLEKKHLKAFLQTASKRMQALNDILIAKAHNG